jgi:hypothetical protein
MICDYKGPMIGSLHSNHLQAAERHYYEIIGNKRWVEIEIVDGLMKIA